MRDEDLRRPRTRAARTRRTLFAQVLERIAHIVVTGGVAAQVRDDAIDLRLAESDLAEQRPPRVELEIGLIDVHERRVAVVRATDRDVTKGRVAERDVDRSDVDRAIDPARDSTEPRLDHVRADARINDAEADREQHQEPRDDAAGP